jgi:hypothetical protein
MACVKPISYLVGNSLAVAVVLREAKEDLNLFEVSLECSFLFGGVLKMLKIMAQHSAELVSELTDQLPLLFLEGACPAIPAQRLLLNAQSPQ